MPRFISLLLTVAVAGCGLFRSVDDLGPADAGTNDADSSADMVVHTPDAATDLSATDLAQPPADAAVDGGLGDADAMNPRECPTTSGIEKPAALTETFASIGSAGELGEGTATVAAGSDVVCLSEPLPDRTGRGDVVVLDDTELHIYAVLDETTVVTNRPAPQNFEGFPATFRRAFSTMAAWEDRRGGDLVGEQRREIGLLYDDGAPFTTGLDFDGNRTDADHYLHLSVAASDRHRGLSGTGVVLRPEPANHGIEIYSNYTRVSWLEITGWSAGVESSFDAIRILGQEILIDHVIVHDDGSTPGGNPDANGINVERDQATAVVRNSIIYRIARMNLGIQNQANAVLEVYNTSLFDCRNNDGGGTSYGCLGLLGSPGSKIIARNVIAIGAVAGSDFNNDGDPTVFTVSSNNISGDETAPGMDSLTGVSEFETWESTAVGLEDFHLRPTSVALDKGLNLTAEFDSDIDGETRPASGAWDIGADER